MLFTGLTFPLWLFLICSYQIFNLKVRDYPAHNCYTVILELIAGVSLDRWWEDWTTRNRWSQPRNCLTSIYLLLRAESAHPIPGIHHDVTQNTPSPPLLATPPRLLASPHRPLRMMMSSFWHWKNRQKLLPLVICTYPALNPTAALIIPHWFTSRFTSAVSRRVLWSSHQIRSHKIVVLHITTSVLF